MSVEVRRATADDIFEVALQTVDVNAFRDGARAMRAYSEAQAADGLCWCMVVDGEPVAAAGIKRLWDGVGVCWCMVGDAARERPKTLHSFTARMFRSGAFSEFRRLECAVPASGDIERRWVEKLGFKAEGPKWRYLPDGGDAISYVRLANDRI